MLALTPHPEIPFILELPITLPFFFRFSSGMRYWRWVYVEGPGYGPTSVGKTPTYLGASSEKDFKLTSELPLTLPFFFRFSSGTLCMRHS